MVGLIFTISLLSIITAVGFIFAWVVRLASQPDANGQQNNSMAFPQELSPEKAILKNKPQS